MRTRIKICGITNPEDALKAVELGVDAIGLVFAKGPRRISPKKAEEIIGLLPPFISTVGVFVDEPREMVEEIALLCGLDVVQFHGSEPPSYCQAFRHKRKVIKAFRVREASSLVPLSSYRGCVDAFLLDAYREGATGGAGIRFDWGLALGAAQAGHIILAGGLCPENVGHAIRLLRPYAVDVSTGVEEVPGRKDHGKMERFVEEVRRADGTSGQ